MNEDIRQLLKTLTQWIDERSSTSSLGASLSTDEKKQLREVNRTIRKLEKLGVSIPDDLRQLKLHLFAKDTNASAPEETEACLKDVDEVIEGLRPILKGLRRLRTSLRKTGDMSGTKKQYGVNLTDLLQNGYLSSEDKYEIQWIKDIGPYEGRILPDGSVAVKVSGAWKPYKTVSGAVGDLAGRAVNGWWAWKRIEPDGKRVLLTKIRARYINERNK